MQASSRKIAMEKEIKNNKGLIFTIKTTAKD
jgi:hypothetical protein